MKTSKEWAYRVYWKHKKKVYAKSEQFKKRKYAKAFAKAFYTPQPLKVEIRKEKKSRFQKKEEKIIKKLGLKKQEKAMELILPY